MIDTIVLTVEEGMYKILDPDRFEPSASGLLNNSYTLGGRGYMKCQQNPTRTELKMGIYKPRLTVTRRFYRGSYQVPMKIEFSAPKLIYKNNFDELTEEDFPKIIEILQFKLKDMGVFIFEHFLTKASISSIHFSKNIPLTDGSFPYMYLKEFEKVNLNKRLDLSRTDFRNGLGVKYHTNSYEIAFYDKIRDLEQATISEGRSLEQDNILQLHLFEQLRSRKPFEVLRMEVRLNKRGKIREILKKIESESEPNFESLFKKDISQKILLYYIKRIEDSYPPLLSHRMKNPEDFLADFIVSNPKVSLKTSLAMVGIKILTDKVGVRGIRGITGRYKNDSWYRFFKEIKSVRFSKTNNTFDLLKNTIKAFEPLRLVDFEPKTVNN